MLLLKEGMKPMEICRFLEEMNNKLGGKVSTKVSKEKNYCKAEGYHQKYEQKKSLKFD